MAVPLLFHTVFLAPVGESLVVGEAQQFGGFSLVATGQPEGSLKIIVCFIRQHFREVDAIGIKKIRRVLRTCNRGCNEYLADVFDGNNFIRRPYRCTVNGIEKLPGVARPRI